jgi:hypothetical protein
MDSKLQVKLTWGLIGGSKSNTPNATKLLPIYTSLMQVFAGASVL